MLVVNKQKSITASFIASTILLSLYSDKVRAESTFNWPNHAKAAVSLGYDDALVSQLDNAVSGLNKYQLKGSFYLTLSSPTVSSRSADWRALARQGHELGNHSINHPCKGSLPNREWVALDNDLDKKTVSAVKQEIINANSWLTALDGEKVRTFTVPCGDKVINGVNYVETLHANFVGIKYRTGDVPKDKSQIDRYKMPVWAPNNVTGAQLIDFVKQAAQQGTIANITFHGIGGDYLSVSTEAHTELLAHLAQHPEQYWVDTFKNISLYLEDKNSH